MESEAGDNTMNWVQAIILVGAVVVSTLILWHDLPIEFPGIIGKVLMLFVKLFIIIAVTIFSYVFASRKKKPS